MILKIFFSFFFIYQLYDVEYPLKLFLFYHSSSRLQAHRLDTTLDTESEREYILFLCPTGPLLNEVSKFYENSYSKCGSNSAHNLFPHVTLSSFFKVGLHFLWIGLFQKKKCTPCWRYRFFWSWPSWNFPFSFCTVPPGNPCFFLKFWYTPWNCQGGGLQFFSGKGNKKFVSFPWDSFGCRFLTLQTKNKLSISFHLL